MSRSHDALIENADVHEKLVQCHILLSEGADKIVVLQTSDGKHRRTVQLGVVKAVKQMDSAGSGGRHAHSELAGVFGITASHECGCLFVAHLDKPDLVLAGSKSFNDSVDPVARQ